MKTKIAVTQLHIAQGKAEDCLECPIALALQDHFDSTCTAYHRWGSIRVGGREQSVRFPRSVQRFIRRVDAHKSVKPFNFVILV